MTFTDMAAAVEAADAELRRADMLADRMASILVGRLRRGVSGCTLARLKRELRGFNMRTGRWDK